MLCMAAASESQTQNWALTWHACDSGRLDRLLFSYEVGAGDPRFQGRGEKRAAVGLCRKVLASLMTSARDGREDEGDTLGGEL